MEIPAVQIPRELAWKLRSLFDHHGTAYSLEPPIINSSSRSLRAKCPSGPLPLSTAEKNLAISIDGSLNLRVFYPAIPCDPMPSQHSPDKEPLSLQIPRTLMGRLRRRARDLGTTLPSYIIGILSERTSDVVLTSKDYEAIAEATRRAEKTGKRCATRFDGAA